MFYLQTTLPYFFSPLGIRYDKKCRYAHSASELRKIERHPRYKTQICRTYHEKGTCPYGVRCTFIHEQQSMANPNIYHHQEAPTTTTTTTSRNSPSCEQQHLSNFKTAVGAAKTDATTPDDQHHHQRPAANVAAPTTTGMPWLSGPDTLLEQQQPNETKELMSLSQIKNVVHSRSASTPNTCWSPTMSNNLWSHRPFHNNEVSSKPLYRVTHVPCYWLNPLFFSLNRISTALLTLPSVKNAPLPLPVHLVLKALSLLGTTMAPQNLIAPPFTEKNTLVIFHLLLKILFCRISAGCHWNLIC